MRDLARANAPVGPTGDLLESIEAGDDRVEATIRYAGFVEFGTNDTPAQPYMRPAADEAQGAEASEAARRVFNR